MKLIINTATLRFGGAIQVALSFIQECRQLPNNEYNVFLGSGVGKSLRKEEFPANFHFYDFDFGPVSLRKIHGIASRLSALEAKIQPDCVVTTSGPSYWRPKAPHLMGYNLPLYIYPESPYLKNMPLPKHVRLWLKRKLHFWFFRRDANAFFVQTDDVNQRVRKAFGNENVFTISNTHNGFYINQKTFPDKLPSRQEEEVRLLTLTAYYAHKNIEIIPELVREMKKRGHDNIQFVLTIDQANYNKIFANEFEKEVVTLGPVKPEECPSLYNECDIMFLPTLAECFSASYPEAMVMEKPIITTDLGFARNICQDAALYYEPMNPTAAADAIEKLLADMTLWKSLVKNGKKRLSNFDTSAKRAGKILDICRQLADEGRG